MKSIELAIPKGEALAEIASSPVAAFVKESEHFTDICVVLPHNPPFIGEVELDDYSRKGVFVLTLEVDPELRENGIGTRLMSAMAYVAKSDGYQNIHSSVDSPHTIRIFRKIFQDKDLTFFDIDPTSGHTLELPMTLDQAIGSLDRVEAIYGPEDKNSSHFTFAVDLGNVALSDLEKPLIHRTQASIAQ